jgi:hypothetical protein
MYDNAGIDFGKKAQYIARIGSLLRGMDETALLSLGKQLAQKASAPNS